VKYEDYPIHYPQMFQQALVGAHNLEFSTKAKAVAFRTELYRYRYTVRAGLTPGDRGLKEFYDDLMKITLPIKFTQSLNTWTLTLSKKKLQFVEKLNER